MRGWILIFLVLLIRVFEAAGQTCQSNSSTFSFFTDCESGTSYSDAGDYLVRVKNGQAFRINGDINLGGTFTFQLEGLTSGVVVETPNTVHAANVVFTGSINPKNLTVEGAGGQMLVDATLDFGGKTMEVDGAGTVDAMDIINADLVTCIPPSGVLSCPIFIYSTCDDGPAGTFCAEVLPVELTFFNAEVLDSEVVLNWQTASEENNDYFILERSLDARNYRLIATTAGAGTSFERTDYSFRDKNPLPGTSYYRLKQVDLNGDFEYFGPVGVNRSPVETLPVSIYPNPVRVSQSFEIFTGIPTEGLVQVNMHDLQGHEIMKKTMTGGVSRLSSEGLKPGIYMIEIIAGTLQKTMRLSVQ